MEDSWEHNTIAKRGQFAHGLRRGGRARELCGLHLGMTYPSLRPSHPRTSIDDTMPATRPSSVTMGMRWMCSSAISAAACDTLALSGKTKVTRVVTSRSRADAGGTVLQRT